MAKPKQDEHGNYWCPYCKSFKPLEDFYKPPKSYRSPHSQFCRICSVVANWTQRQKKILHQVGPAEFQQIIDDDLRRVLIKQQLLADYQQAGDK